MDYRVDLTLEKNFKIRIKSNHPKYLKHMKEEFSIHVPGYFFMPKYKAGIWDGKTHFISEAGLIPYGLLFDLIKLHKKEYKDLELKADDNVKRIFNGSSIDIKYDLSLQPREYQKEAIELCLKYTKGIIRSATASGKSLVVSYIIKNLLVNRNTTNVRKCLIIVPSTSLVEQFKNDMIEYGIPEKLIGKIYTGSKQWDRHIVISTWQSLKNNHKKINMFDCIIGDECHQVQATEIKKIFSLSNANYRFGFTGTLPNNISDIYSIKSYIGPVLKEYPSGLLAEQGYISKCNVKLIELDYPIDDIPRTYISIKEYVFKNKKRLSLIENIIKKTNDNILLLVSQISEGVLIEKLINRKCKNKTVIFLSGKDKIDIREEWRQKMINGKNIAIVATYGIFQQGINIPNLKYLLLTSPTKSKIRTLQSVGRALRIHENKIDGAYIFDIVDNVKFLKKHAEKRIEYYNNEGFNIEEIKYDFLSKEDFIIE